MVVELRGVHKSYSDGDETVEVLRGVDLSLAAGTMTSLIGVSGSGKSTLISLLAGLLIADAGEVRVDGADLTTLDERARARLRARRIGVALQSSNLVPFLTAEENVRLAQDLAGTPAATAPATLLERLGVAHRRRHRLSRLSGGEAQHVSLAVALANRPILLLADEVVGAVDVVTADQVMAVVQDAWRQDGTTVLFVTHNAQLATGADQQLRMDRGRVVAA